MSAEQREGEPVIHIGDHLIHRKTGQLFMVTETENTGEPVWEEDDFDHERPPVSMMPITVVALVAI
jgi:hypothetical protein